MSINPIKLLIIMAIFALNSCSVMPFGQKDEDVSVQYLPQMVIDKSEFDRDIHRPCKKIPECTAPLTCIGGECIVPPSITGNADASTPIVKFTTSSGEHTLKLEIVEDEPSMARGLMMRRLIQKGWGMLFIYPDEGKRSFWMHNTFIPLDMVFIRADGSVSNVTPNAEPLNDIPRYMSTDRVKYVLEIAAGSAQEYGIESGSKFEMPIIRP